MQPTSKLRTPILSYLLIGIVLFAYVASGHADDERPRTPSTKTRSDKLLDCIENVRDGKLLIAAHRGGYSNDRADAAPENSVANVDVAVRKGFDVYETDVRRTKDGVLIVVHDATLQRETNGTGPVEEMLIKDVAKLKKRFRDRSLSEHGVSSLESMLRAGQDSILFKVDLKPGVVSHFDDVARLVVKCSMQQKVFLRTELKHADVIARCFAGGTPKVEVMFRVNTEQQVRTVHGRFAPTTIQVNISKDEPISPEETRAIRTACELGMLVETHCNRNTKRLEDLIQAGVRMFHTNTPLATQEYLQGRKN